MLEAANCVFQICHLLILRSDTERAILAGEGDEWSKNGSEWDKLLHKMQTQLFFRDDVTPMLDENEEIILASAI